MATGGAGIQMRFVERTIPIFSTDSRPPRTRAIRLLIRITALSATSVVGVSLAPVAEAASAHNPRGSADVLTRLGNVVTLSGWATDPDARSRPIVISLSVDSRVGARFLTDMARTDLVGGERAGFATAVDVKAGTHTFCVTATNVGKGKSVRVRCARLGPNANPTPAIVHAPTSAGPANSAIAAAAASFVGGRYVDGGTTPAGFDCSGLTQWVYQSAAGISIPRNALAQFAAARVIPKAEATVGDLIFFHSGPSVFHVGVYDGANMMWAAASPSSGIRYQSIWSPAVSFGTFTH